MLSIRKALVPKLRLASRAVNKAALTSIHLNHTKNEASCIPSSNKSIMHRCFTSSVSSKPSNALLSPSFINMNRRITMCTRAFSAETSDDTHTQEDLRKVHHIRNVAIVAHVDHGKTTIVDELLRCASETISGGAKQNETLVMDCGDLERERGITITSKVTRLDYHHIGSDEMKTINVVDTPGHADFAGEVDRILTMIDGVCLVVDAAEGAMAQTKYVLSRALKMGLKPIVILNKCDKDDAWGRIEDGEVEVELLETFDSLGANDEQMDYVTVYASGKSGWATLDMDVARKITTGEMKFDGTETSMRVLLDTILDNIPAPVIASNKGIYDPDQEPFAMAATTVGRDNFLGRLCTGRIESGSISKIDAVALIPRDMTPDGIKNATLASSNITGMFVNRGVLRTELESLVACAGDIVTLAGVPDSIAVGDTLTLKSNPIDHALNTPPINPPTISMEIGANTSPMAGMEGTIVASARVRERLYSETDNNVTLSVTKSETDAERSVVHARGELQLGILIEQMRREGFELTVSPPKIITTKCELTGQELEPFEEGKLFGCKLL